jgi:putative tricarboxylic transport membrane protein
MKGRLAAAGFVAAALAAGWQGWEWGFTDFGTPGPGLFPALAAGLMGGSALLALRRRAPKPDETDWLRLLAYVAGAFVFPVLLEPLGMVAAVVLLFLLLLAGLERMQWRVVLPVTAGAAAGSFLLFDRLLKVPLPRGWLWG